MDKTYDVLVIGAGPAGVSAAVYAVRAGLSVIVLDRSGMPGGQVLTTYEVDNYLGIPGIDGFDLGMKFKEHADKLNITIHEGEVTRILEQDKYKLVQTAQGNYVAKTVVFAAGASHAKLGVTGEEEFSGMGVSYCATCDGAFFKDKTVAVVGGSDVAVEDAVFLARSCKKVYLIHRRNELRAARSLQETVFKTANIEILWESEITQINGSEQVESVTIYNKKTEKKEDVLLQGVFIAIGMVPGTELLKGLVEMDDKGHIKAGEDCVTSVPGIFAAGDVRTKKLRQIITAAADGANAIASAEGYIGQLDIK